MLNGAQHSRNCQETSCFSNSPLLRLVMVFLLPEGRQKADISVTVEIDPKIQLSVQSFTWRKVALASTLASGVGRRQNEGKTVSFSL